MFNANLKIWFRMEWLSSTLQSECGILESCWIGNLETEFLFPALLHGDVGHSLYLVGPQFPHLQRKKMTNNSSKNTLGISDVIRLSLPPFRLLIALIFSNWLDVKPSSRWRKISQATYATWIQGMPWDCVCGLSRAIIGPRLWATEKPHKLCISLRCPRRI